MRKNSRWPDLIFRAKGSYLQTGDSMPIYGLTHKNEGTAILRRSVTTKIAIGLPPKDKTALRYSLDLERSISATCHQYPRTAK